MRITLNGIENPNNIITFTNCPTILTVSDSWTGTRGNGRITINKLGSFYDVEQASISINGYTISSTGDLTKAIGNRFYLTTEDTIENRNIVANTIVNALRNVSAISVNYDIYIVSYGVDEPIVRVEAKTPGYIKTTIETSYSIRSAISTSWTNGSTSSVFNGQNINKIFVDIYSDTNPAKLGTEDSGSNTYMTTIEKNVYNDDVSFDLSSIFNIFTSYDKVVSYMLRVYSNIDGKISQIGYMYPVYAVPGYFVNQGGSFIPNFSGNVLAQNVSRGKITTVLNRSILYVYYNSIVLSLYSDYSVSSFTITINYLDNTYTSFATGNQLLFAGNTLNTYTINLNQNNLNQASYVDIVIPNLGTLRYTVVKPIHATDETQRIYWTNSYGGTSFFDFTGTRTEERKTDIETYERSLYDYYNSNRQELKKIYSKEVKITVTLTTHNIQKDGTWQLFDLQNSYNAWTTVNGKEYAIHITDIQVDETDVAGIYTAQIEYEYSMGDTF